MISSSQNPRIKLVRELLSSRRAREEKASFIVEGVRLTEEVLNHNWLIQFALWSADLSEVGKNIVHRLQDQDTPCEEIPTGLLQKVSDTTTSQGILLVVRRKDLSLPSPLDLLLVLDGVRDPGNFGTLLRSAAAFGAQAVCLSDDTVDAFSPKVLRSGMGAHFYLPIIQKPILAIGHFCHAEIKPPLMIYSAEMQTGDLCWKLDLRKPVALIIGGEAAGTSHEVNQIVDGKIRIPMPGGSESLNAAVAGSILLYEVMRQRQK